MKRTRMVQKGFMLLILLCCIGCNNEKKQNSQAIGDSVQSSTLASEKQEVSAKEQIIESFFSLKNGATVFYKRTNKGNCYFFDVQTTEWLDSTNITSIIKGLQKSENDIFVFSYNKPKIEYAKYSHKKISYNSEVPKSHKDLIDSLEKLAERERTAFKKNNKPKIIGKWGYFCIYKKKGKYYGGTYENLDSISEMYNFKKLDENKYEYDDGTGFPLHFIINKRDGDLTILTWNPVDKRWDFLQKMEKE